MLQYTQSNKVHLKIVKIIALSNFERWSKLNLQNCQNMIFFLKKKKRTVTKCLNILKYFGKFTHSEAPIGQKYQSFL